jgi:hypothetical protein
MQGIYEGGCVESDSIRYISLNIKIKFDSFKNFYICILRLCLKFVFHNQLSQQNHDEILDENEKSVGNALERNNKPS